MGKVNTALQILLLEKNVLTKGREDQRNRFIVEGNRGSDLVFYERKDIKHLCVHWKWFAKQKYHVSSILRSSFSDFVNASHNLLFEVQDIFIHFYKSPLSIFIKLLFRLNFLLEVFKYHWQRKFRLANCLKTSWCSVLGLTFLFLLFTFCVRVQIGSFYCFLFLLNELLSSHILILKTQALVPAHNTSSCCPSVWKFSDQISCLGIYTLKKKKQKYLKAIIKREKKKRMC